MIRPASPEPGRRSAVRRSRRARAAARGGSRTAPAAPQATAGLTTRVAVLGLVVCALVLSAALPLREFLSQRARISQMEQDQSAQRARVTALEDQRRLLDDPAYVASLARERLQYVRPGETTYVVVAPEVVEDPAPSSERSQAAEGQSPWYSQLLGGVREADRTSTP